MMLITALPSSRLGNFAGADPASERFEALKPPLVFSAFAHTLQPWQVNPPRWAGHRPEEMPGEPFLNLPSPPSPLPPP